MVINEDQMDNAGKHSAKINSDETCYLGINGNYEKTFHKYTLSYESINIIVIQYLLLHSIFHRFDGRFLSRVSLL